ncbi:MAG: exodeoxyribonuclease 7 large subunit [Gemmatales bacterium]|nr:MAG: exodeoxyribonuclease 7 large subunit [Gemmatales bacterium]
MTTCLPDSAKILSVSDLTQEIKNLMEEAYPHVWVSGQVSNVSRPASGHCYFTLKDAHAQLRAVLWRGNGLRVRFQPQDGTEVIAGGRLSVYSQRGEYQLIVEALIPKGIGELEQRFRELKEKLLKEGLFRPENKKPLPRYPRRVAIVTSPTGAAIRDMLQVLSRRWPNLEIYLRPVRVQGEEAPAEIADAIDLLNACHRQGELRFDAMIVGRGGGSLEDLWAFNEEIVARAIHASEIPVISAVGHEIDFTIADLVADRRAATPTEAAELLVPDCREELALLQRREQRLRSLMEHRLAFLRRKLDDIAQRRVFRLPLEMVREQERGLDELGVRLVRAEQRRLKERREQLQSWSARLESLSPLNILARGYSLTSTEAGQRLLRDAKEVRPGDRILTRLHRGRIISKVEATE